MTKKMIIKKDWINLAEDKWRALVNNVMNARNLFTSNASSGISRTLLHGVSYQSSMNTTTNLHVEKWLEVPITMAQAFMQVILVAITGSSSSGLPPKYWQPVIPLISACFLASATKWSSSTLRTSPAICNRMLLCYNDHTHAPITVYRQNDRFPWKITLRSQKKSVCW